MYNAVIVEQANRYKEYLLGCAYIPYQNLSIYENAYRLVYGK